MTIPPHQAELRAACLHPSGEPPDFDKSQIGQSLVSRFEQQVARFGNRPAVRAGSQMLTYEALNRRANQVAHALRQRRGPGPEPVPLLLDHGVDLIGAMLGVLKAGKFYVPLDPTYPPLRLEGIGRDLKAAVLVSQQGHASLAQGLATSTLWADGLDRDLPTTDPGLSIPLDAYAYILFTSGSTGKPKGVIIDHRDAMHFSWMVTLDFNVCSQDRLTLMKPCTFSGSATDIYGALLNGALLCMYDIQNSSVAPLATWLDEEEVTLFTTTSGVFRALADTLAPGRTFPRVRALRLGADQLRKTDVERVKQHFVPGILLRHGYGSSEVKFIRQLFIDHLTDLDEEVVPVGYTAPDVQVQLVDSGGRPVPPGQVGQIVVQSRYMSPGYWGQPELTQQRFKAGPAGSHERLYHTGDQGFEREDGALVLCGRTDFQTKVRGQLVAATDVEQALVNLVEVADSVVVAQPAEAGDHQLVAYVVPAPGAVPTTSSLHRALQNRLPAYMIPARFVVLERMPLNAHGKVDRKALPPPQEGRPALEASFAPPRTPTEKRLVRLWEEVLDIEPIGVDDPFLELGGESLLAAEVAQRVGREFDLELDLASLVVLPTVSRMARYLDAGGTVDKASTGSVPLQPGGRRPPLFLASGGGGGPSELFACARLACLLGAEQPVYGLLPGPLAGGCQTLADLAVELLEQVRGQQPCGPYRLGGECIGGWVAFEMGRQLAARGEEVELLVLLNTPAPGAPPRQLRRVGLVERVAKHARQLRRQSPLTWPSYVGRRLTRLATARPTAGRARRQYIELLRAYRPPAAWPGAALLLVSGADYQDDRFADWPQWLPRLEGPLLTPGDQYSYLGDEASSTAQALRTALEPLVASA